MKKNVLSSAVSLVLASQLAFADDHESVSTVDNRIIEEVFIIGGQDELRTLAGSGSLIDEDAIATFDATDINDLISQIPGVYIRYEDGYGLRPNIGIRGVTSDRSQKITLMEDGILISPAPYTAPAAYYFPNVNRMKALELVKGPAAIEFGPHTIGGALNMVTEPVPEERMAEIALTYGTDNYQKYSAKFGDNTEQWGYLIEGLRYSADGFKDLDTGGDTGFVRNDINAKLRWSSDPNATIAQELVVKVGYADEDSDETYLGLSDEDFAETPNRRYAASQLDNFDSEHQQLHILHTMDFESGLKFHTRLYNQKFNRAWNKFDGFIPQGTSEGLPAQVVLANPNLFPDHMSALRGEIDTTSNPALLIDVTNNDREYGSYGLAFDGDYILDLENVSHEISAGIRFHHDYVERHHKVRGYFMENSNLVFDGLSNRTPKALNEASSDALAIYVQDEITYNALKINVGVRYETIDGEFDDELTNSSRSRSQDVFAPGVGVHYQLTDSLGLLGGVYHGFSPAGPSSDESVDPEEATNYEYGFRYIGDSLETSVIGFFSDYSNLIGRCRASDTGCVPGDEFNGGEVEVSGVELTSHYVIALNSVSIPLDLVYTFTESAFQNGFESGFSQWGTVSKGDQLPYLPENQLRASIGLESSDWTVEFAAKYVDDMLEVPSQGEFEDGEYTPSYTLYDISATWQASDRMTLQLIGENITDKQVIVARRPFGARPNQPRSAKVGISYSF